MIVGFVFLYVLRIIIYSFSVVDADVESSSLLASLNSLIPLPRPLMSSGIFFPPNINKTTTTIKIICHAPGAKNMLDVIIIKYFELQI